MSDIWRENHINKKFIIIFILLNLAFVILVNVIFNYFQYFHEIEKSNMLYINTFAEKLYIEDNHEFIDKVKNHDKSKPFIIWQKLDEDLIGLLYWGNFDFPPTIEGRFFIPSDFYCNKHLAVIGKNITHPVIKEGNALFIDIFGDRYKIIGVIGHNYPSNIDNSIYYNLDSNISSNVFYIDGKNSTAITKIINDLSKIVTSKRIDDPPTGIGRLFGYSIKNFKIKVVCLLICIVAIILSINFFINANYSIIIAQHIIGASVVSIILKFVLKMFSYLFVVLIFGTLVSNTILTNLFVWQVEKDLPDLIFLLGICYLFPQLVGAAFHLFAKIGRIF